MEELLRQIRALEKRIQRYEDSEFSKVVPLVDRVRVLNDTTPRTAVYGPNNLTITGAGGLPSNITGVWYQILVTGNSAANAFQLTLKDPDSSFAPVVVGFKIAAAGDNATGSGFIKLGAASGANPGQLTYTLASGTYSLLIIDIVAYLL